MLGGMGLHDCARAAAAGIFRAAGHQHAQLRRHHVQPLADVLADPGHLAAAARTQPALRLDDPLHPRQMGRQVTAVAPVRSTGAVRAALDDPLRLLMGGIEHALGDFGVLQRQMILLGGELLRPGAELLAPKVADDALQPPPRFLGLSQGLLRLRQLSLQTLDLVVENGDVHALFRAWIRRQRHARRGPESVCRTHPASCGRRTRSRRIRRQSSPSNNAANIAGDIRITPSRTCGHTNFEPSSRLCTSTSPVRSVTMRRRPQCVYVGPSDRESRSGLAL